MGGTVTWTDYERAPEGIAEVALDGQIRRANRPFCEMFGYSEAELCQLRVRDITHPEDRPHSVAIVDWALSHTEESQEVCKRYVHRDGRVIWALLRTTLRRNDQGEPDHFLSFVTDVSDRIESDPLVRALTRRIQIQQERERHRIARELHDELGQTLTALKLELNWLKEQVPPQAEKRAARLSLVVDEIGAAVTRLWLGLRPFILDELGLIPALDWLLQETCGRAKIQTSFTHPKRLARLDSETRIALFRICQEALSNVVRHSQAGSCDLSLHQEGDLIILEIRDDGVGLPSSSPTAYRAGMLGMRDRVQWLGGSLQVEGSAGTSIRVELPLSPGWAPDPHKVPSSWE